MSSTDVATAGQAVWKPAKTSVFVKLTGNDDVVVRRTADDVVVVKHSLYQ